MAGVAPGENDMHVATNYKDVFDHANDAIFIHDELTGAILDANRLASNLTGFRACPERCHSLKIR